MSDFKYLYEGDIKEIEKEPMPSMKRLHLELIYQLQIIAEKLDSLIECQK